MSSWISRATENRNAQLVTTAVVSGVVVASAILGLQKAKRMYRVADLKASIPDITDDHHSTRVSAVHGYYDVACPVILLFSFSSIWTTKESTIKVPMPELHKAH